MANISLYIKDFKWFLAKKNIILEILYLIIYKIKGIVETIQFVKTNSPIINRTSLKSLKIYEKPQSIFYFKSSTSGTTNTPLKVFRSLYNILFEEYVIKSYLHENNIPFNPKIAVIRGDQIFDANKINPPFWIKMPFTNRLIMSSYHISFKNGKFYLDELFKFNPDLIMAYPSSITALSKIAIDTNWKPNNRLKGVLTSSETFHELDRKTVESVFGQVLDHYGQAERVASLQLCNSGNYHVREDYSIVEFFEDQRGIRIIGSNPKNKAMPLERYDTEDYVEGLGNGICNCGKKSRFVKKIIGRNDDSILLPDGRIVGRLSTVFRSIEGLLECQVIQNKVDNILIKYVPISKDHSIHVENQIRKELQSKLGAEINIEFIEVGKIERSKSGKFKTVINQIKK